MPVVCLNTREKWGLLMLQNSAHSATLIFKFGTMGKIRIAVKPAKGQTSLTLTAISDNCGCTSIRVTLPEK